VTVSGRNYQDLLAWQRAIDLVEEVYTSSRSWPKEELYGLTNQVRRAVVSVPSNIAEGQGRRGRAEFLRHLSISHGSLREVETQLMIARRLRYLTQDQADGLLAQTAEVGRLLQGLMRSLDATTADGNRTPTNR
jgi:four helix bundle protein